MEKLVNKSEISKRILEHWEGSNINKGQIEQVLELFLKEIDKVLMNNEKLDFKSHFSFFTVQQEAKKQKVFGKEIEVPAKRVPKVKFSRILKDQIK